MSAVKWFSGPPPDVGWWPVPHKYYRWWNGEFWSYLVADHESSATASESAAYKAESQGSIIWRHWSVDIDGTDGRQAHTVKAWSIFDMIGEEEAADYMHSETFTVVCDASKPDGPGGCGAVGGYKPTIREAIEAWNSRADHIVDANKKVDEEQAFCANTGGFFCTSIRVHDEDAKAKCPTCWWEGQRKDLTKKEEE